MPIKDEEVLKQIEKRLETIKDGLKKPEDKKNLIEKIDFDIKEYRAAVGEKINSSDSAIAKMIFKNIDDDKLFNRTIKKMANEIAVDKQLYDLTLAMNTVKFAEYTSKINHKRFLSDPTSNLAMVDLDHIKYKVAERYVEHIASNVDLDKERKKGYMKTYNNEASQVMDFMKVLRSEELDKFKDSIKNNDLYNNVKTLPFEKAIVEIGKVFNVENVSIEDVKKAREAYTGIKFDKFEDKYSNGALERNFTVNQFPTFKNKEREYSFDFLQDMNNLTKQESGLKVKIKNG